MPFQSTECQPDATSVPPSCCFTSLAALLMFLVTLGRGRSERVAEMMKGVLTLAMILTWVDPISSRNSRISCTSRPLQVYVRLM